MATSHGNHSGYKFLQIGLQLVQALRSRALELVVMRRQKHATSEFRVIEGIFLLRTERDGSFARWTGERWTAYDHYTEAKVRGGRITRREAARRLRDFANEATSEEMSLMEAQRRLDEPVGPRRTAARRKVHVAVAAG